MRMIEATATEVQVVVVVEDSRARQACRQTRLGWATTIHTALATIEAHPSEVLLVDASACRAGRACVKAAW
jgi:hypothetical protein